MNGPGPLRMEPVYLPKVWAAKEMAEPWREVLKAPPGTGEVWLASDRLHLTRVAEGELTGLGLDEVVGAHPEWILGRKASFFPLLLKVLSVGSWLSVQVHPDDEAAKRLENEPWGKSEAWHMLQAEPGSEIVMGLGRGVGREEMEEALEKGSPADLLAKVRVHPGDTYDLAAGTIHAAGPGLCFFEIQQASDVTYRFYDWDRPDENGNLRELHQEKALEVMKPAGPGRPVPPRLISKSPNRVSELVKNKHFALLSVVINQTYQPIWAGQKLRVLFVLQGSGYLTAPGKECADCYMTAGHTWVLPANLPPVVIEPGEGGLTLLESIDLVED